MSNKIISTTLVVVCLGALACGGAVYTPTAALAQGTANPCTDSAGATWGFYKSNVSTGARTPLTGPYTRASGLKGFASNGGAPYIAANDTAAPVGDKTATNNESPSDPRAIQPGELLVNVLEDKDTGKAILRFTPPHAGLFDVSATFRAVNYNGGQVDVRVMVNAGPNGEVPLNAFLSRPGSGVQPSPIVYNDRLFLTSAESLDFVVGFGADDIHNDGTGLKVEIRDAESDDVTNTFDAGAALADAATSAAPANPWPVPGGAWSWLTARCNETEFPDRHPLLETGYLRTTGSGFIGMGVAGVLPFVSVNTNAACVVDGSNRSVAPGELFIHPGVEANSLVRFTPSQPGRYRALYEVRDLALGGPSAASGVRLIILANGEVIDDIPVSWERAITNVSGSVCLPPLHAGEPVEFCIHNNAQRDNAAEVNNNDATGLRLVVQQLADEAQPPVHDFGADFAAEEARPSPENPFISSAGIVWEVGKSASRTGAFTPMSAIRDREPNLLRGWCTSASATLPALCANISGGTVPGGNALQSSFTLYPREFWFHPGESEYGHVRFKAPSNGVYRARGSFRDVNRDKFYDNNPLLTRETLGTHGVDCHIVVDGLTVASDYASEEAELRSVLDQDLLYLEKDEILTFLIGPNGNNACDATAARAYVMPAPTDPDEQILSIDLKGQPGGTAYAGRGRVGWATTFWNPVAAERASKALQLTAQTRVAARFAITNDAGTATAATASTPNALVGDGVSSTGPDDVYTFTFTGLAPSTSYTLYLYGAKGRFIVGDAEAVPSRQVFTPFVPEVAVLTAGTDETGTLVGTFRAAEDAAAVFGGLQIVGAAFPDYVPTGTLIVIR